MVEFLTSAQKWPRVTQCENPFWQSHWICFRFKLRSKTEARQTDRHVRSWKCWSSNKLIFLCARDTEAAITMHFSQQLLCWEHRTLPAWRERRSGREIPTRDVTRLQIWVEKLREKRMWHHHSLRSLVSQQGTQQVRKHSFFLQTWPQWVNPGSLTREGLELEPGYCHVDLTPPPLCGWPPISLSLLEVPIQNTLAGLKCTVANIRDLQGELPLLPVGVEMYSWELRELHWWVWTQTHTHTNTHTHTDEVTVCVIQMPDRQHRPPLDTWHQIGSQCRFGHLYRQSGKWDTTRMSHQAALNSPLGRYEGHRETTWQLPQGCS